jgi:hypothetical protein
VKRQDARRGESRRGSTRTSTTSTQQGHVNVTKRIDAPAARIFALLTDPARHPGIAGSGMVRDGSGNETLSAVGDVFRMQMHHQEWGPVVSPEDTEEKVPGHYVWGYALEPDGDATIVTEFFD